jgi:hypothetical protein
LALHKERERPQTRPEVSGRRLGHPAPSNFEISEEDQIKNLGLDQEDMIAVGVLEIEPLYS